MSGETSDERRLSRIRVAVRDGRLPIDAEAFPGLVRQFVQQMREAERDIE